MAWGGAGCAACRWAGVRDGSKRIGRRQALLRYGGKGLATHDDGLLRVPKNLITSFPEILITCR
jgi:hypothetical protein